VEDLRGSTTVECGVRLARRDAIAVRGHLIDHVDDVVLVARIPVQESSEIGVAAIARVHARDIGPLVQLAVLLEQANRVHVLNCKSHACGLDIVAVERQRDGRDECEPA